MTRLLLLRHGRTRANHEKRFQGRLDLPLDETGVAQSETARDSLRETHIDRCYCSPLKRALQTAEIVLKDRPQACDVVPLIVDDRLQEISLGDWEGWPSEKVRASVSPELVHWTGIPPLEFRPPGGETIHEVRDRVRSFLTELPETNEMTTILIVAHQVVLSLIRVEFDNLRIEDLWQIRQEPGQIIELNPARRARRNGESE